MNLDKLRRGPTWIGSTPARRHLLGLVVFALLAPTAASSIAEAATPPKAPTIISVTGRTDFSWKGGTTTVTVRTHGAVSCAIVLRGRPYLAIVYHKGIHGCGPGEFTATIKLGDNPFAVSTTATFSVLANSGGKTVRKAFNLTDEEDYALAAKTVTNTTIPARPVATTTTAPARVPPVVNLDVCKSPNPSANCYYGPIYNTYQTYGNASPAVLGDCTFAAAADWMQIELNTIPDGGLVGYDFAAAGGSATNGLPQQSLWNYWESYGIDGVYLTGLHSYLTDQADVQNGVVDYGAMIIELNFAAGTYFGNIQISAAGLHDAVVDGFTPEGPLVVSWGMTIQMTWPQWNAEVIGMWGLGTNPS